MNDYFHAQEQHQVSYLALMAVSQGVVISGPDRLIRFVNDAFVEITGYAKEEILGRSCRMLQGPLTDAGTTKALGKALSEVREFSGEILNYRKDGTTFWNDLSISPVRDERGMLTHFIGVTRDVTSRNLTKARLAEAKDQADELNKELQVRIAQANELAIKAERASEVKSTFVANMSHEIRTPMNGIMGMIEVLLGTNLSPEQEDFARTAYRSTEALMEIINDVLDFSKLEAQRLVLEHCEFDLHDLVFQVAELFRSQLAGRPLEMLVSIANGVPRLARGDPGRVRQILSNLVGNAVKFTEIGHIRIDVTWVDCSFVLAVSDTGIGIPQHLMGRLFTAFTQIDNSHSRSFGGTGLGLELSRHFAELMHGTLTVASDEGRGSTFTATLPLELAPEGTHGHSLDREPSSGLDQAPGFAGKRILVVDDNTMSSQITMDMLAELGARPATCVDDTQALDILTSAADCGDPFIAAIIDLRLQGTDGLAVAQAIRQVPGLVRLPLLMLTGASQSEDSVQFAQAGFNGFLVKPVRFHVFAAVLAHTIMAVRQGHTGLVTRYSVLDQKPSAELTRPTVAGDVLLVEDHEVNRKIVMVALGKIGVTVSVAENGHEAVDMVLAHRYDVVLMDCQMPVMDGYEATQTIRNRERLDGARHVPIIAMTANAMPGSRERCLAAGMDDYLAKPFSIQHLENMIRQWMGSIPKVPEASLAQQANNQASTAHVVIDPSILREIERTDVGMAAMIMETFRNNLKQDLVKILHHMPDLDFQVLGRSAHKVKGSSGSIGAFELQRIASELEAAASAKDEASIRRLVDTLDQASRRFLTATAPECFNFLMNNQSSTG